MDRRSVSSVNPRPPSLAAALLCSLAACGGSTGSDVAHLQTLPLEGRVACGRLDVSLGTLTLSSARRTVTARIRNTTGTTLVVGRPHSSTSTRFGLLPAAEAHRPLPMPQLVAASFSPPLPHVIRAGERWAGRFSGPGRVAPARPLRVILGRFTPAGRVIGFLCVSDRDVVPR